MIERLTPEFPVGSPEYTAYRRELRAELAKFAAGDPPYEYGKDPLMQPVQGTPTEGVDFTTFQADAGDPRSGWNRFCLHCTDDGGDGGGWRAKRVDARRDARSHAVAHHAGGPAVTGPVQGPAGAPFRPGDRFRWKSGNGLTVRTGTILEWQPYLPGTVLAAKSWGSWFVEVEPLPRPRGAKPRKRNPWDGFRTWFTGNELGVVERVT